MATFAAIRNIDGLLASLTNMPQMPSNLIERAIESYGGVPSEWQTIMLTDMEAQQLPSDQNGDSIYLNSGTITIVRGFPLSLMFTQRNSYQRGFITNKKVTDFRKRTITRFEV